MQTNTARKQINGFTDLTDAEISILKTMDNNVKIRNHLYRYGSITSREAMSIYGVTRLSSVIYRLRYEKEPLMEIVTVNETGENRFGQKSTYARYYYQGEKK